MGSKAKLRIVVGFALAVACLASALLGTTLLLRAQEKPAATRVKIEVNAARTEGEWKSIWNFWGYDEPNYTHAANGKKLLREFAQLSPDPVYIRVHNLFTTGDGTA